MVQILHKEMLDKGVRLIVGDKTVEFKDSNMILASGKVVEGEAVVMAVGVAPDSFLAKQAGLDLNARGAIKVDANYRTSDPDIYAVGDAIEVYNALTHKPFQLALAGPAQNRQEQLQIIFMDVLYAIADILVPAVSKCLIIMRQAQDLQLHNVKQKRFPMILPM